MTLTAKPPANIAPVLAPAVTIRGLHKRYGSFEALRGIDLDVAHGEVLAVLGPNGAGKTTMVEILEGYRQRTSGEVRVLGVDPDDGGRAWRSRLGIVLQNTTVFDDLTVDEVVRHFATFYPNALDPEQVVSVVGLEEKRGVRCGKLSGGQKRRVDLALGLIGDPDLIFLDEPTTGLDPEGRRQVWDVIRELAGMGKTVLLTTHYLDEAEALATRVAVIINGEIAALGAPAELGGRDRAMALIRFEPAGVLTDAPLPALEGKVTRTNGRVAVRTAVPTPVLAELIAWSQRHGVEELPGLSVIRPSLEDVYLEMVRAAGVAAEREVR